MPRFSLVIAAAGRGTRAGGGIPKQFRPLGGVPLWKWSAAAAERLFSAGIIAEAVLVLPRERVEDASGETKSLACPFTVCAGGDERSDSVLRGASSASGEYVLVHDGARPFLSPSLCLRITGRAGPGMGVIPLLPVSDSLKTLGEGSIRPFPREGLYITQTPQCFPRESLILALSRFGRGAGDEAEAWAAAGFQLLQVEGERRNMKITFEEDFPLAESMIRRRFRTGIGYDIHPLVPGRRFVLGGVRFPDFPLGFQGHSDGDVLVHAVCDAILGAAGMGDLGTLFPAEDEAWRDMDSTFFLKETSRMVIRGGWSIEWVDGVIIAQEPRLRAYLPGMTKILEEALSCGAGKVHLKAKSGEGIGPVGSCSAVVCHAAATLSMAEGDAVPWSTPPGRAEAATS